MTDFNNDAARRVAAELALVRLEKERRELHGRIQSMESDLTDAESSFRSSDIMSEQAVAAAWTHLPQLRAARENSIIPRVGAMMFFGLLIVCVIGVAVAHDVAARLLRLVLWGGASVVVYFGVVGVAAYIDSRRDDHLRDTIARFERDLAGHNSAVICQERIEICRSVLPDQRRTMAHIEEQIARNLRIVR